MKGDVISNNFTQTHNFIDPILDATSKEKLSKQLEAHFEKPSLLFRGHSTKYFKKRQEQLQLTSEQKESIKSHCSADTYENNIENFIGTCSTPLGVIGPLRVNGMFAKGDFIVPLATTEATLVASYHRGASLITHLGGCSCALLAESVSRAPAFVLHNLRDIGLFATWLLEQKEHFSSLVEETSSHCKLQELRLNIEGNHLYLICEYTTGNAAGQNMVTIATQALFNDILKRTPVHIEYSFIEANMSGDKKASQLSFLHQRGKKVSAEITLTSEVIKKYLHTDAKTMFMYWQTSALGAVMSGTIGTQGHYANGLAALFLATGQDIACVAEAAVGITRFELKESGDLYVSVTLPNIIVGTVGGGTSLPSQKTALEMMKLPKENSARALAEIAASLILGGEISIIASICANDFTKAHKKLARK